MARVATGTAGASCRFARASAHNRPKKGWASHCWIASGCRDLAAACKSGTKNQLYGGGARWPGGGPRVDHEDAASAVCWPEAGGSAGRADSTGTAWGRQGCGVWQHRPAEGAGAGTKGVPGIGWHCIVNRPTPGPTRGCCG